MSLSPLAASVDAVAAVLDAVSGHSDQDPQWVRHSASPTRTVGWLQDAVVGRRVGVVVEALDQMDEVTRDAFDDAVDTLDRAGVEVVRVSVPMWNDALAVSLAVRMHDHWMGAQTDGVGYGHRGTVDVERTHVFGLSRRMEADSFPPLQKLWMIGGRFLHENYFSTYSAKAMNARRTLAEQIERALEGCDALLAPTTPRTAPRLTELADGAGGPLPAIWADAVHACVASVTGHPSTSVPVRGADADASASVQFIGRHWDDAGTLRLARRVEAPHDEERTAPVLHLVTMEEDR